MNLILGGGITGVTTAYKLHNAGQPVTVLEAEEEAGGASRTMTYEGGFRFDLGGHRLYTKIDRVMELVRDLVGDELIEVDRISRIYMNGRFADYPLTFKSALASLGPATSVSVALSYAAERLKRIVCKGPENTFEDWVVRRFGRKLHSIYFAPYSEKVWGVPCDRLSASFAAQRIRGLSMREALKRMLLPRSNVPATLTDHFWYPRLGFGRIHETMIERMPEGTVVASAPATQVLQSGDRITSVTADGREVAADQFVLAYSIVDFVRMMQPRPPAEVLAAADALKFRDLIICFFAVNRERVTRDHWTYFPSEDISFSRIHEPKNWSAAMAPEDSSGIVTEIFCFADDPVWQESDDAIVQRLTDDLERLALVAKQDVAGARVVRLPKAYPIYDVGYQDHVRVLKRYVTRLKNLHCTGRMGTFRYTSGDYCIEMGIQTAENVLGADHDLFEVGAEQTYAEG